MTIIGRTHLKEEIESEAKYKGYQIFLSKVGNFFVFICGIFYLRRSLKDSTELIDQWEKEQKN